MILSLSTITTFVLFNVITILSSLPNYGVNISKSYSDLEIDDNYILSSSKINTSEYNM